MDRLTVRGVRWRCRDEVTTVLTAEISFLLFVGVVDLVFFLGSILVFLFPFMKKNEMYKCDYILLLYTDHK